MKSIFKTTAALCGSALLAVTGSLVCLNLSSRTAYAEENCDLPQNIAVQNKENNAYINLPPFYSGITVPTSNMATYSTYSAYSVNSLQCSTIYGEWSDSFLKYNCYAFALGRTDDRFDIGYFSGNKIDIEYSFGCSIVRTIKNTISELAEYTAQDLKAEGYPCVYKSKNTFFEPFEGQTLICVRKAQDDFHFMKYVNGDWLHKPGTTWILKYNGTPNANDEWKREGAKMLNGKIVYSEGGSPYTGDIYFIKYASSHNYCCYEYKNANEHSVTCRNCTSSLRSESHTFKPYKPGAKQCTGCNYILYDSGLGQVIMKDDGERI